MFGLQKNSNSICSNSRVLNTKLPGVISFLKDFQTWATPKGTLILVVSNIFLKLTNIHWAVSGRRYMSFHSQSITHCWVLNIRLNLFGSVQSQFQHLGHLTLNSDKKAVSWSNVHASGVILSTSIFSWTCSSVNEFLFICSSINLSALSLYLHLRQSTSGSEKEDTCHDASQTFGFIKIDASSHTISWRSWTKCFHQASKIFLRNNTQYGHKSQAFANHQYISDQGNVKALLFARATIVSKE